MNKKIAEAILSFNTQGLFRFEKLGTQEAGVYVCLQTNPAKKNGWVKWFLKRNVDN